MVECRTRETGPRSGPNHSRHIPHVHTYIHGECGPSLDSVVTPQSHRSVAYGSGKIGDGKPKIWIPSTNVSPCRPPAHHAHDRRGYSKTRHIVRAKNRNMEHFLVFSSRMFIVIEAAYLVEQSQKAASPRTFTGICPDFLIVLPLDG